MTQQPRDSRLRYTKECLYESFLHFLEDKPVPDITVSEICDRAGISRKTFYKYYPDQFGLLASMQNDLFARYREQLESSPADVREITPVLIRFADENRTLVKAVFANRGEGNFIDRMVDDLWATYRPDWERANPDMAPIEVEYLFCYIVSGLVGIVRHWLYEHPEMDAAQVAERANRLLDLTDPRR